MLFLSKIVGCALLWVLLSALLSLGFARLLERIYSVWGLTSANVSIAPDWIRTLVSVDDLLISFISNAITAVALAIAARRLLPIEAGTHLNRRKWLAPLCAIAAALLLSALCMAIDVLRMEWPASEPRLGIAQLMTLLALLSGAVSRAVLLLRVFYRPLTDKGYTKTALLLTCLAAVGAALPITDIAGGFAAVFPALCACAICDRRGMAAAVLMMCAWPAVTQWLLAWPNAAGDPVYSLYTISESWLPELLAAVVWGAACIWLWRKKLSTR